MMAKKRGSGKRRFRKYLRGPVDHEQMLGTLGGHALISAVLSEVLTEKAWLSSVVLRWSLDGFTQALSDGPILVGVAHSDYTSTEIEEWVENASGWSQADKIGQEIGRRQIKQVGVLVSGSVPAAETVIADGLPIRTKCGWQLITGQTLRVWAYNMGTSPLASTDPTVHAQGHANLWPN